MGKGKGTAEDREGFRQILRDAIRAVEEGGIPYVVFGGIAAVVYGRPRHAEDIDLLVQPQDARRALDVLDGAGFSTEETNPRWIYKATKDEVLVDVIFQVKGDIYLDDEMLARARVEEYEGQPLRLIAPEDAVVIEAISHENQDTEHWYNALSILAGQELDWEYLLKRAEYGARRALSLLIYAQSNDLLVPDHPIRALFEAVYAADVTNR